MDFNTTIDIIIKDLREAREIIDDFKNYQEVPKIQIELAKSKCKSAEEIIALLKTMKNEFETGNEVEVVERVERVERVEKGKPAKTKKTAIQDDLFEIGEKDEIEQPAATDHTEKVPEILSQSEIIEPSPEPEVAVSEKTIDKLPESGIFADKFSGISNTYNEQHGNIKGDVDISASLKSRPVSNLTEAIGINDKFLFVREIFNGNQLSYNEAIAKLNKVENISDAKAVIMSYTGEGDENEAVKQLLDVVKRKLPADE